MTKAEAIKLIDDRMCFGRGKWSKHHMPEIDDYWKAGQIAIKALEETERKKGKWITVEGRLGNEVECNQCHSVFWYWMGNYRFCPSCGADMRGESE